MATKEVQAENGHRVRVETDDDLEALSAASDTDPSIWYAGVVDVTGRPVGWDGGDAEDAIAEGLSIDAGDMK